MSSQPEAKREYTGRLKREIFFNGKKMFEENKGPRGKIKKIILFLSENKEAIIMMNGKIGMLHASATDEIIRTIMPSLNMEFYKKVINYQTELRTHLDKMDLSPADEQIYINRAGD